MSAADLPPAAADTTEPTEYKLTKLDIARLRTADQIVLRYNRAEGVSRLEAYKEPSEKNPWPERHYISAAACCNSYQEGYRIRSAFALCPLYKFGDSPIKTVLDLLRPRDDLTIEWSAANDNDHVRSAGYHMDEVSLRVTRGTKRMLFLLDVRVGPSDTARMCQMEPGSEWCGA